MKGSINHSLFNRSILYIKIIKGVIMHLSIINLLFLVHGICLSQINRTGNIVTNEDKLRFLDSLNAYRLEIGSVPLQYSFQEDSLARLRVATIFKHVDSISESEYKSDYVAALHYKFKDDIRAYDKKNVHPDTVLAFLILTTRKL